MPLHEQELVQSLAHTCHASAYTLTHSKHPSEVEETRKGSSAHPAGYEHTRTGRAPSLRLARVQALRRPARCALRDTRRTVDSTPAGNARQLGPPASDLHPPSVYPRSNWCSNRSHSLSPRCSLTSNWQSLKLPVPCCGLKCEPRPSRNAQEDCDIVPLIGCL